MHRDIWRNGSKLVSVTELQSIIAKPFLDKWKQGLCQPNVVCGFDAAKKIAEEAADLGNRIHEEIASYLIDPKREIELSEWGNKLVSKIKEIGIKKYLIEPEETLIDNESGLAGSPDFVGLYNDPCHLSKTVVIGDLKIKNTLDPLTALQGCGYRYLIKRLKGVDIPTMLVLHAQKKTKSMLVKDIWIDLDEWMDEWYSLVKIWNKLNKNRQVKIYDTI